MQVFRVKTSNEAAAPKAFLQRRSPDDSLANRHTAIASAIALAHATVLENDFATGQAATPRWALAELRAAGADPPAGRQWVMRDVKGIINVS